jgi:DNA-binding transcriptional regulator YdaS (Cro superfamily)
MNIENLTPIEKAAQVVGGISQLAAACEVSPQAVHKWIKTKSPAERCIQIELATEGKVTRYELRPDVFGEIGKHGHRRLSDRRHDRRRKVIKAP